MTRINSNVGHFDAISRRVVAPCALLGGLASLDGFFWSMGFLTAILIAIMIALGFFYITGGFRGGSAVFGIVLILLAVLDGWLALHHQGTWALRVGGVVAVDGFVTAATGWSPINRLLGKDTHYVDQEWATPHPAH